jgi:hypothetical protein
VGNTVEKIATKRAAKTAAKSAAKSAEKTARKKSHSQAEKGWLPQCASIQAGVLMRRLSWRLQPKAAAAPNRGGMGPGTELGASDSSDDFRGINHCSCSSSGKGSLR